MIYNFILNFFFKISLIYILKSLLILFYTFRIFYKFGRVFGGRFYLIYYLDMLFHNLIIISDTKNLPCFFLKEDLFIKKPLYLRIGSFQKIYLSPWPGPVVRLAPEVIQSKENASVP